MPAACFIAVMSLIAACTPDMDDRYRRGVEASAHRDYSTAERWLTEAANAGHIGAMQHLASLYLRGHTGRVERAKAEQLLLACSERVDPQCQELLGLMYMVGYGEPPDPVRARHWLQQAVKNGATEAGQWIEDLDAGRPPARAKLI